MPAILLSYILIFLLFTILFSSQEKIQTPFLKNKIVQLVSQSTSSKLYDFFIFPLNDNFKNLILPFLSSENLLDTYFHFQNLYPNVSITKFLPHSTVKTSVFDLQKSYFAYIFENEYSFFNPIIFNFEKNYKDYRTVTLGRGDNNTKENSFYALSASNKLFPFESIILPQNREVFTAFDDNFVNDDDGHFFAAEKKAQGKLTVIAYGIIPDMHQQVKFSDYLEFILEANHLNCFKKYFYFKFFDLYRKYDDYITKTRWSVFVSNILIAVCPWTSLPAKILYEVFRLILLYITYFPIYSAEMLPFYILSFPFEYIFQSNFVISGIITKHYVWFRTLPCFFNVIAYLSYFELNSLVNNTILFSEQGFFRDMQIKPQEIKWAVPYLGVKKKLGSNALSHVLRKVVDHLIMLLIVFGLGFLYTLPFLTLMMIHGESNE